MALNFPDSPTLNEVYTDATSGFSYVWNGTVWISTYAGIDRIKIVDDISSGFDDVTALFNLTSSSLAFTPLNAQQLQIVLGGVIQKPTVDYTVSGSSITFTTPPQAGLTFSAIWIGI